MRDEIVRQQIVRQPRPVGGHAVAALDRADRDRVLVRALVAHDADALHRQQHREALPQPRIPAVALALLRDTIASARRSRSSRSRRDLAEDPDGQARSRERLPDDELLVEPELRGRPRALRP